MKAEKNRNSGSDKAEQEKYNFIITNMEEEILSLKTTIQNHEDAKYELE